MNGTTWVIVYNLANFTPVPNQTVIKLTLLLGTYRYPALPGFSLQDYLNGPAMSCDPLRDNLFFFFKYNNVTDPQTIATQAVGTVVNYAGKVVTISMPIITPKISWTNNGAGNEKRLCDTHPGGIYLASRIYTMVRIMFKKSDLEVNEITHR